MNPASPRSTLGRHLLVGAAILAASASSQALNLFVNPGFETGTLSGWTSGGPTVAVSSVAHTGSQSVAAFGGDFVMQTFSPVATSDIQELSFWGKRSGGLFDQVTIGYGYNDSSSETFVVNTIGGSSDWTFINLTSQLDAGKSLVSFQIYGTSPGPAYLDDFNLKVAAVPDQGSSLALLGLGFAGVVAWRKVRSEAPPARA